MPAQQKLVAFALLAGSILASPAPQVLDFAALDAAEELPSGPDDFSASPADQAASLYTSFTVTASASATVQARDVTTSSSVYTPYYPALATSYTTDPALTGTTSAGQACATTPEDGTYCGFINPQDPCAPQPDGYGPVPTPDTASAFLSYAPLHSLAQAAPTTVPSVNNTQYSQVFKDLNAAVSAQSYLGLITLETYDVARCAAQCDDTDLCSAFNIYAERDPSLNPSKNDSTAFTVWGYWCPNPASMTSFKCTLWGSNIDASLATNTGSMREDFEVVITASDGYDKTNVTVPEPPCPPPTTSSSTSISKATSTPTSTPTWPHRPHPTGPSPWKPGNDCHGKAINAPHYSIGSHFFPGPFNPQACSDYAVAQNKANQRSSRGGPTCEMFNAYYLHKNNQPFGTYCSLFSKQLDNSWATFSGARSGKTRYDCKQSWSFAVNPQWRG
ncbi:hypothetical protein K431DRAFT_283054 [Polychaeton citri CBS 116435]|uniref:Uncharacterized protein n=1 Tax=Polychaeton citri CBS 116435 TaxID=1314669 RepID=A0A9P4QBA7_9PEZI|nr:hypothetical protein K431DRAFT_283054 [Polychaeton citri CBS 116435]